MLHKGGVLGAGVVTPLALQSWSLARGGRPSRLIAGLASLLTLAGGLALRYVLVTAGKRSADDPAATFELTRAP